MFWETCYHNGEMVLLLMVAVMVVTGQGVHPTDRYVPHFSPRDSSQLHSTDRI